MLRKVFACRGKLARQADLCVLPQTERLSSFLKATGRTNPTYCVWNCPRSDEVDNVEFESNHGLPSPGSQLVLYYHGSITPTRLPGPLIIAASRFKGLFRVRIAGYETLGSIGYVTELTRLAAMQGAAGIVEFLGAIPEERIFYAMLRALMLDSRSRPNTQRIPTWQTWWVRSTNHLTTWPAACRFS
jgi:hypothetical protein